jgi:hypothetical protein
MRSVTLTKLYKSCEDIVPMYSLCGQNILSSKYTIKVNYGMLGVAKRTQGRTQTLRLMTYMAALKNLTDLGQNKN